MCIFFSGEKGKMGTPGKTRKNETVCEKHKYFAEEYGNVL